jgi:hypothetical protein
VAVTALLEPRRGDLIARPKHHPIIRPDHTRLQIDGRGIDLISIELDVRANVSPRAKARAVVGGPPSTDCSFSTARAVGSSVGRFDEIVTPLSVVWL